MAAAPTISIFRTSGGSPVAQGVLVTATRVRAEDAGEFSADPFKAGLLSPWPGPLDENEPFGVQVPNSEKWLIPDSVDVLVRVEALNGANPDLLEAWGKLARSAQGRDPTAAFRPAGATGQPETRPVAVTADRYFSLLCRILLRD
jgi:hypothetical protein